MPLRYYSNASATTLNGAITSAATTMVVTSVAGFPATTPYTVILDLGTATEEVVEVTAVASLTLTITRAADATTAFAHSTAAAVAHGFSARDLREPNSHINDAALDHHTQYFNSTRHTADAHSALIAKALVDVKGDLIAATAADAVARLAVGTNGQALKANSATSTGLEWGTVGATAPQVDTFTASGTWTKPTGAVMVEVRVIAGGGGGKSEAAAFGAGGGGGGGGVLKSSRPASAYGATETVTVGAGGAAQANGGSSAFGTVTVTGGVGATLSSPGGVGGYGAAAGGTSTVAGGIGEFGGGGGGGANNTVASAGGTSVFGGGGGGAGSSGTQGAGGVSVNAGAGGAGTATGTSTAGGIPGGGGGGGSSGTGGAGARGEVVVITYF